MALPPNKTVARVFADVFILTTAAFLWEQFAGAPRAYAIPAFARKYQTSCSLATTIFPS